MRVYGNSGVMSHLLERLPQFLLSILMLFTVASCTVPRIDNPENFNLYSYLLETEGISYRAAEALSFLKDDAEKGNIEAQFKLGVLYYIGRGVTQNFEASYESFHKAAEQGDTKSRLVVGVLCAKGQGTIQNLREAEHWLKLASEGKGQDAEIATSLLEGLRRILEKEGKSQNRSFVDFSKQLKNQVLCRLPLQHRALYCLS